LTERQISSEALDTEVAATALIGGAAADADQPFAKEQMGMSRPAVEESRKLIGRFEGTSRAPDPRE
jgi:hypothetical protein